MTRPCTATRAWGSTSRRHPGLRSRAPRGPAQAPIRLESRVDTPKAFGRVQAGESVAIAGVAWQQHVGVSKVEGQISDGPWAAAGLAPVPSTDTWVQ